MLRQVILKRFAFLINFVCLFYFFSVLLLPPSVSAQNKIGVNIGDHFQEFSQAAGVVGSGGYVVVMAGPGDCASLQAILNQSSAQNIIIRGQTPGSNSIISANPDAVAKSWALTLGNLDTKGKKVYFMPWNEPNGPGAGDVASENSVKSFTDSLQKHLNNSGSQKLRGNKVILLAPMINQFQAGFENYLANLGGGSYFNQFDGLSMNLYDNQNCGSPLCSTDFHQNASRWQSVANQSYQAPSKPIYALESGVVVGGPTYNDPLLSRFYDAVMPSSWQPSGNFVMSAVFSYDPEHEDPWNLYSAPQTLSVFNKYKKSGSVPNISGFNLSAFQNFISSEKNKGTIIDCAGSCGIAPKEYPQACYSSGGGGLQDFENGRLFTPARVVETGDLLEALSDTSLLVQNEIFKGIPRTITRGGFFADFEDLSIPFAKELTRYLAGPFIKEPGQNSNLQIKRFNAFPNPDNAGVLAKLYPEGAQDYLRHLYRWKCGNSASDSNGYYCSRYTIGVAKDCPGPESNECLFSDGTEIADGLRKPLAQDPKYKFANGKFNSSLYEKDLSVWNLPSNKKNRKLWQEIPLVSNPNTLVGQAIFMDACPAPLSANRGETLISTRTPWVSALKDVSQNLNDLLVPKGAGQVSIQKNDLSLNQKNLLASSILASPKNIKAKVNNNNYLAQEGSCPNPPPLSVSFSPQITKTGTNVYSVCWSISGNQNDSNHDYCDWGYGVTVKVKGKVVASFLESLLAGHCFRGSPTLTCTMGSARPIIVSAANQNDIEVTAGITQGVCTGPSCGVCDPRSYLGGSYTPGPPACVIPQTPNYLSDPNADPVNIEGKHALLREPHYPLDEDHPSVGINDPVWAVVKYPFLSSIYNNLSGPNGIFQLFRPSKEQVKDWDWAGLSYLSYCFEKHGASSMVDGGLDIDKIPFDEPLAKCIENERTKGLATYPKYIGGVQNAKNWVVSCVLNPNASSCSGSSSSVQPTPGNTSPDSCRQKCEPYAQNPSNNPLYNTSQCPIVDYKAIDFRNPNDEVADKARLVSNVKGRFPSSEINSKLDYVIAQSKQNNWSPAFIVALWIEESGASGIKSAGDPLGCDPYGNQNSSLEVSLNCLFNNFKNETDFNRFLLRYSSLVDRDICRCFCLNPNFPQAIKREYQLVSQKQL